jgi:hypothetical protein
MQVTNAEYDNGKETKRREGTVKVPDSTQNTCEKEYW